MKNLNELHIYHTEISSEILFAKKEVEFLLKILGNCYSTAINEDKLKLLDSYWKSFEQNIDKLDLLLKRIQTEEKSIAVLVQDGLLDSNATNFKEDNCLTEFKEINSAVKILKESFYEFMHGCDACSLKQPKQTTDEGSSIQYKKL